MDPNKTHSSIAQQRYTWRWRDLLIIVFGIALILFLGVLVFISVTIARGESLESLVEPTINQTLGLTALEAIALILGVYIFGLRRRGLGWSSAGLRPVSWSWVLISVVATLIIIPIASLITLAVLYLGGQPLENP
ncbi:MAG: hypothetical protein WA997_13955, partial [Anaerolineales bacterium]